MNRKAIQAYNNALVKQEQEKIIELLSANKMGYDFNVDSQGFVEITVENGDWKHDHLALRNIMREAGYIMFGRDIKDEDNGDDSYTATYRFR